MHAMLPAALVIEAGHGSASVPMKVKSQAKTSGAIRLSVCLLSSAPLAFGQGDGIFAEFNTSMGSYTCRVEYAKAPKAAANFIGLATGERAWLDLTTGLVKTEPFYDGQIFHRVIAGFMNQGGSPNGQGTDGPGCAFVDEFDTNLLHTGFGDLSMANSGPDSNGSQFFTTATKTDWLDFKHTVFGRLTGGSNVVYAINNVATDANDKPLTNVVLNSVAIRRVGAAAQAFDIHSQGLPDVTALTASIAQVGTNVSLTFSNQLNVDNRLYSTANLATWSGTKLGLETVLPVANSVTLPMSQNKQFFRMAQIQYPDVLYVPTNVLGATITFIFSDGLGTLVLSFDEVGTGTYEYDTSSGTILGYNWIRDPYRGRLKPVGYAGGLYPMDLHLDYDSSSNGTFLGTVYPDFPSPLGSFDVSGMFTSP